MSERGYRITGTAARCVMLAVVLLLAAGCRDESASVGACGTEPEVSTRPSEQGALLPLVRGAGYVYDSERNTEVFVGDFTAATFGRLTPDEVLDGVDTLAVDGMFGHDTGSGRLTVDRGTATFASTTWVSSTATPEGW